MQIITRNIILDAAKELLIQAPKCRYCYRSVNPYRRVFYVPPTKIDSIDMSSDEVAKKLPRKPQVLLDLIGKSYSTISITGMFVALIPGFLELTPTLTQDDLLASDWIVEELENEYDEED